MSVSLLISTDTDFNLEVLVEVDVDVDLGVEIGVVDVDCDDDIFFVCWLLSEYSTLFVARIKSSLIFGCGKWSRKAACGHYKGRGRDRVEIEVVIEIDKGMGIYNMFI